MTSTSISQGCSLFRSDSKSRKLYTKSRKKYILPGVDFVIDEITHIDPDGKGGKDKKP